MSPRHRPPAANANADAALAGLLMVLLTPVTRMPIPIRPLVGLRLGNTRMLEEGGTLMMIYTDTADIEVLIRSHALPDWVPSRA